MALAHWAVYRLSDGLIENVIWWDKDEAPNVQPPDGSDFVQIPNDGAFAGEWSMCGIGWSYLNNQFVEPPKPPEPVQPKSTGSQTF